MRITVKIWMTLFIFKLTTALTALDPISRDQQDMNALLLNKVVQFIVGTKLGLINRRALNPESLAKARSYYKAITKQLMNQKSKPSLRTGGSGSKPILRLNPLETKDEQASLVESELKTALSNKKSALFDKPYVEHKGRNDFLVLRPDIRDPFVTVVPNHIYYDIEKKCVNWLDDCSLSGIRERLLRGVASPYK